MTKRIHADFSALGLLLILFLLPLSILVSITLTITHYFISFYNSHPINISPLGYVNFPGVLLSKHGRPKSNKPKSPDPLNVLVTGSDPLALSFAREFWKKGNKVYVSDFERRFYVNRARLSRAVTQFIPYISSSILQKFGISSSPIQDFNLTDHISKIVEAKSVDIWIPLDTYIENGELTGACHTISSQTSCTVLYPPKEILSLASDSKKFEQYIKNISGGIKRPKSSRVNSRGEVHNLIGDSQNGNSKFLISPISKESSKESNRHRKRDSTFSEIDYFTNGNNSNEFLASSSSSSSHILPLDSINKTFDLLAKVDISSSNPWQAADVIVGKVLKVNSLIIDGCLANLSTSISSRETRFPEYTDFINHKDLTPLDQNSSLQRSLLAFTTQFVTGLPSSFSSCLNLTFLLQEKPTTFGYEERIWVLGVDFELSEDLFLFDDAIPNFVESLTRSSSIDHTSTITRGIQMKTFQAPYSFPTIFWDNVIKPFFLLLLAEESLKSYIQHLHNFTSQILYGKEYLFEFRDPFPFIWYWVFEQPISLFSYRR